MSHSDGLARFRLKTGYALALIMDGQMPIQMLVELHACVGIATLVRAWGDL